MLFDNLSEAVFEEISIGQVENQDNADIYREWYYCSSNVIGVYRISY